MSKLKAGLQNFLIISRANIQIASVATAMLGVVLAAQKWEEIINLSVLIYLLLFFLILTFSCNINCISDVEVDQKFKRYMSEAIRTFKPGSLKRIIFLEVILIIVSTSILCILKQNIIYSVALFGLLCGFSYSVHPVRLKKRGVFSPVPVIIGLYFFPIVFGWFIVSESISVFILLFALGYALLMQGITLLNTCEDFTEDKISGITTLAHVLGLNRTLRLASIFVLFGGILDLALLILYKKDYLFKGLEVLSLIIAGAFFLGATLILISKTLFSLSQSDHAELLCKKHAGKMRWWFMSTRYPLLVIALFLVP